MTNTQTSAMNCSGKKNPDVLNMLQYAVKAPSGHNTQPWVFRVLNNTVEIHPDFSKALPAVDPDNRELFVSLGCAAENLMIAATAFGYQPMLQIRSDDNSHVFIRIALEKRQTEPDNLFPYIEKRQTNRSIYRNRIIRENSLSVLKNLPVYNGIHIRVFDSASHEFETITSFVEKGNNRQMTDKAFKDELVHWMRFNKTQEHREQDGLTNSVMGLPSIPSILGKFVVKPFMSPASQNKSDLAKIQSASNFVLFTTEMDNEAGWISLGRIHQRFLLEATRMGISGSYLNQPCEVRDLAREMARELKLHNEQAVLLMRLGYATAVPYSPRRNLEKVLEQEPV